MLCGVAIVDQHAGKILLGNGNSIDGASGNILNKKGGVIIKHDTGKPAPDDSQAEENCRDG